MVGVKEIKNIFTDYVISSDELEGSRQTIAICDRENTDLRVECTLTDNILTEVYFLNNQFYEQESDMLLQVARDIVDGNYTVKSNFFKSKQWIMPRSLKGGPERVAKTSLAAYKLLPRPFGKK